MPMTQHAAKDTKVQREIGEGGTLEEEKGELIV
jgi:hypothetical protein